MAKQNIFTDSGIKVNEVYTAIDNRQTDNSLPGQFPFTSGVQPDMYRGKLWTMRQYAGFSTAEESNKRYHYLLSQGVSGQVWLLTCQLKSGTTVIIRLPMVK